MVQQIRNNHTFALNLWLIKSIRARKNPFEKEVMH